MNPQQFQLLFIHDRLDILRLIPRELAFHLKISENEGLFSLVITKKTNCIELLEYLLDLNGYDANVNKQAMYYAVKANKLEIVKWLVEKGQRCNIETFDYATEQGNDEILKLLRENYKFSK